MPLLRELLAPLLLELEPLLPVLEPVGLLPVLPVALPLPLLLPDLRYPPEQALPLLVLLLLEPLEPLELVLLPGLRAVLLLALPEPVRKWPLAG